MKADGAAAMEDRAAHTDSPAMATRERVAKLLTSGHTVTQIAHRLSLSKATVCHHARRLGHPPSAKFNRRYDWAEVQRYYDDGHTVRQCREHFGFANQTWNNAVKRGDVVARPRAIPLDELLVAGRLATSRSNLKLRLLANGLKNTRCEECGVDKWRGRPLSLALHHVNGDRNDNRLANLQLLCPNCHSQTENFAGRNGWCTAP
ncbi:MAG: HNH endonuclease [Actinomycetota bacterium]|nr:HNH endonuclease [Actinomycetota bacterium]